MFYMRVSRILDIVSYVGGLRVVGAYGQALQDSPLLTLRMKDAIAILKCLVIMATSQLHRRA